MAYQVCPGCFMCACLLDRFINARAYDTARRGSPTTHYTPCSNITNGIISRRCCCLRLWNKRKREIWTESLPAYTLLLGRRRHCCHCCWFIVETFVLQLRTSLVAMTSALLLLLLLFVFFSFWNQWQCMHSPRLIIVIIIALGMLETRTTENTRPGAFNVH